MNTSNIKKYAPKARNAFIAAMTKQAARYGITAKGSEPMEQRGDLALIGGQAFPKRIVGARNALETLVEQQGFNQTMEQAAYSWFNRLCAIRFMELKGYLDHGRRVLSAAYGSAGTPQILEDCLDIELPGLDRSLVADLKLDGNRDEELYRELLLAQCHALHEAMPFLFEAVDDATELLLPENLTKTDSLIRELVSAIPEEDWEQVEVIGWLYQFYISEKKEQVIGKVVKSEDIPAATQLFTPNWIVQYLVQNSVGRQWLQTYPDSPLKEKMPYYIEPAEQTEEVQAQLRAITTDSIDPESIKVLDPACGSGHILVEAYKVLKAIYEERGYRNRDIPKLILEKNLYGLDIDDRAGQLAGFALMMLAREDDRRIFSRFANGELRLNVLSLKETGHLNLNSIWQSLNLSGDWQRGTSQNLFDSEQVDLSVAQADSRYQLLERTLERFVQAKTFGSLIQVPEADAEPLKELLDELERLTHDGDSMQKPVAQELTPYLQQSWALAQRYDAIIANPPYMGNKFYNPNLKQYVNIKYSSSKGDLYSAFIMQNITLAKPNSFVAMITIPNWMFLSGFEDFRKFVIENSSIDTFVHNGRGVWGSDFGSCSFVIRKYNLEQAVGKYKRLFERQGSVSSNSELIKRFFNLENYIAKTSDFKKIPGCPIAYWISDSALSAFSKGPYIEDNFITRKGMATGLNAEFVRAWHEVEISKIGFDLSRKDASKSRYKWYPYANGGDFRKWYGNYDDVVNWEHDGLRLQHEKHESGRIRAVNLNLDYIFRPGLSWTSITSGMFAIRYLPKGFLFSSASNALFGEENLLALLGLLNSSSHAFLGKAINPTLNANPGDISKIPLPIFLQESEDLVTNILKISKIDWDSYETSWNFKKPQLIEIRVNNNNLKLAYDKLRKSWDETTTLMQRLERENNLFFKKLYGFQEEVDIDFNLKEVSINCNPKYRYGDKLSNKELEDRLKSDTIAELISYSIGCILGRYSLDREGLVYADASNDGFVDRIKEGAYQTFPADEDGILPLTDQEWFHDDATNRFRVFVKTVWGEEPLQENLDFVAESLCLYAIKSKRGESSLDTIRRYLSTQFYKDHLRTYKKRPIYWLFSSGKQKAFECLVYLHRYNEGTLARMRTEYVIPLTAKLNTYVEKLEQDRDASSSAAETKRLEKEIASLHKQQAELATFDEKLRHYADQRISLDLDDGVKVNYGKFGDLLAEVKTVTGEKPNN